MNIEEVKLLPPLERFIYWIKERRAVQLKKEAGKPPPWTDDTILQTYKFCNVCRIDDKVSRWLLKNWYWPNVGHPNMVIACALARLFNLPASLSVIGFPKEWNPDRIKTELRRFKSSGENVFNGAYMVRGLDGVDKVGMVVDNVVQPLVDKPPHINTDSIQESVEALLPYWGLSSFMAGQIVGDLRWGLKGLWRDRNTWAALGPGSMRGLNRLHDAPVGTKMKQQEFLVKLTRLTTACADLLPPGLHRRMEAIDRQNCLCEWDKYERALWSQGRPKQLYQGARLCG